MREIHVAFPEKFSHVYSLTDGDTEYINSGYKKSAPASPNHEQSKNATHTTTLGCYHHPTMNRPDMQERAPRCSESKSAHDVNPVIFERVGQTHTDGDGSTDSIEGV